MSIGSNANDLGNIYHDCTVNAMCTNIGNQNKCTYEYRAYGSPYYSVPMKYQMQQNLMNQPQKIETFTNDSSNNLFQYGTLVGGGKLQDAVTSSIAVDNGKNEIYFSYPKTLEKNSFCGIFFPNKSNHA